MELTSRMRHAGNPAFVQYEMALSSLGDPATQECSGAFGPVVADH